VEGAVGGGGGGRGVEGGGGGWVGARTRRECMFVDSASARIHICMQICASPSVIYSCTNLIHIY